MKYVYVAILTVFFWSLGYSNSKQNIENQKMIQNYFPYESISFRYEAVISKPARYRRTEVQGHLYIVDAMTYKDLRKETIYTDNILRYTRGREIFVQNDEITTIERTFTEKNEERSPSRAIISRNNWNVAPLSHIWILRDGQRLRLKDTVSFNVTEYKNRKVLYCTLDGERTIYYYLGELMPFRIDCYSYKNNAMYISKKYFLDSYVYKDGYYFPTKVIEKLYKQDITLTSDSDSPLKELQISKKKYIITRGVLDLSSEYKINKDSLKFNCVSNNELNLLFPNACRIQNRITGKTYIYNNGVSDIRYIKEKCDRLNSSKYFIEVNELENQSIPYILTECSWSNPQNTNKALIVLPHKQLKNVDFINCGDKEKFVAHLSTLISLGKNIGRDVISGIHVIPDSRPGLPHVYIRIIIFNGKEKLVLNLYEVHYIWNQRHMETNNKEINKINKFLREYIDILESYKAMKALDCFSPRLDYP